MTSFVALKGTTSLSFLYLERKDGALRYSWQTMLALAKSFWMFTQRNAKYGQDHFFYEKLLKTDCLTNKT